MLKWESLKKYLYCYIKVLNVKPVYQQMTLSPKLGVVKISTLWHFRLPLLIQMFIKVASSPRLSGFWNALPDSLISSAEGCVAKFTSQVRARTNSLVSDRRFTSKLSWSWSTQVRSVCCTPQEKPMTRGQRRLIRLVRCPAWSEFFAGRTSFCWFCHMAARSPDYGQITQSDTGCECEVDSNVVHRLASNMEMRLSKTKPLHAKW